MPALTGLTYRASSSFTRPSDTTAYNANDLVANNVVGSSVTPLVFTFQQAADRPLEIVRAYLNKSTSVTANGAFLLHLFSVSPTCSVSATGDNGVMQPAPASISGWLGTISVTVTQSSSAGTAAGWGNAGQNAEVISPIQSGAKGAQTVVYGLLQATAAYSPGSAEVFFVSLEAYLR